MEKATKDRLKEIFDWTTDPNERMRIWSDGTTTIHTEGKVMWVQLPGTPAITREQFELAGGFE